VPSTLRRLRIALPLALALFVVDCTTKELAVETLAPEHTPHAVAGDLVRFTLVYNQGAAMGLPFGTLGRSPLVAMGLGIVGILLRLLWRTSLDNIHQRVALGLVLGGALGNLLSRVRSSRGVVDFIDLGVGASRFYIFNVADIGVCVGACLLALAVWSTPQRPPPNVAA
jgi:signal peptidase II